MVSPRRGRPGGGLGSSVEVFLLLCLATLFLLTACASAPIEAYTGAAPKKAVVFLYDNGWHTEIGIPATRLAGSLDVFRMSFPNSCLLIFGWGNRDYFMAERPTLLQALRAVFPSRAVLRVTAVETPSKGELVLGDRMHPLVVAEPGLARLERYIWSYVVKEQNDEPRLLGWAHNSRSAYFEAGGTYDLFHNSNTWTAAALHTAGLEVHASGVFLAEQVLDQVDDGRGMNTLFCPEPGSRIHSGE